MGVGSFALIFQILYALGATGLGLYGLHALWLTLCLHRPARFPLPAPSPGDLSAIDLPAVTVQLPIYNERHVVVRLLDACARFDYPPDRLQIQLLDDSTDQTTSLIQRHVEEWQRRGVNVALVHRDAREGYKAGALRDGLASATGEFIAIFDADFTPRPDFLRTTMTYFEDPKTAIVQTRWEHINADYSMLTKLQALQLNVHFTVEQAGRSYGNLLLQFNGTAGVWRKKVIDEAGGWQSDTLTEDLDLSFRAQIMGYKIQYLEKLGSPAELPVDMNALKGQQFRWNKGGAQNARKLLKLVWNTDKLSRVQKMHAISQLMAYGVFLWVFIAAVSSIPLSFAFQELGISTHFLSFSVLGLFAVAAISYTANITAALNRNNPPSFWEKVRFFGLFLSFMPISMGLSLYNAIAVIEGLRGKVSAFVRTPKYGITGNNNSFQKASYLARKISWVTYAEGGMALIFFAAVIIGIKTGNDAFVLFHSMLAFGFATICYYSIKHLRFR